MRELIEAIEKYLEARDAVNTTGIFDIKATAEAGAKELDARIKLQTLVNTEKANITPTIFNVI